MEEPIAARPIRGEIVNKTGALVHSQEGRFEFAIREGVFGAG